MKKRPIILIMRHAKSSFDAPTDFERVLDKQGRKEPGIIREKLKKKSIKIDKAVVSSSVRTKETWELIKKDWLHLDPNIEPRLYRAEPNEFIDILLEHCYDTETLLIIGHNPTVGEVVFHLTGESVHFETASCAILEAKTGDIVVSLQSPKQFTLKEIIYAQ